MGSVAVAPYLPSHAGDVTAAQKLVGRALARAGFGKLAYATRVRRRWDESLTARLNEWRKSVGISNRHAEYTREDHQKLARWWDEYNHQLAAQEKARLEGAAREHQLRARVVGQLTFLYNRRLIMAYTQRRPWDRRPEPRGLDCSATKGWADEKAGAPRTGQPWGYGNTYTQIRWYREQGAITVNGRDSYAGVIQPGDPVYYGAGPGHVAVYIGNDRVASFGSYPMKILRVDYRPDRSAICSLV